MHIVINVHVNENIFDIFEIESHSGVNAGNIMVMFPIMPNNFG